MDVSVSPIAMKGYGKSNECIFTAEGRVSTKLKRIRRYRDEIDESMLPASHTSNCSKEELCLEYVSSFHDQFSRLHPNRLPPYLTAENECGLSKLVCATIRPTLLPYSELYDYTECASFLAGFVHYEPLNPVGFPPSLLPSPIITLEQHTGDSFDIAVLLCSFLLGAGYNAYVVNGYAPRSITLRDQSKIRTPLSRTVIDTSALECSSFEEDNDGNPYIAVDNSLQSSTYLASENERKLLASLDSFELWIDEDVEWKEHSSDKDNERRVHAWVMIAAGCREVKENIFVEPTTGRSYLVNSSPYLGIESLWNHKNIWINLKNEKGVNEMDYDLTNGTIWEFVFMSTSAFEAGEDAKVGDEDCFMKDESGIDSTESAPLDELALDSPPSWSAPLRLQRQTYLLRHPPRGHRTVQYYKSKVDFFAKNIHPEGIVMRITSYHDKDKVIISEVHEWLENRKDRMYKRSRYNLKENKKIEYYHPGSLGEVKQWNEYPGKRKDIYFHVNGRLDRMYRREEIIGEKICEYYEGRTDCMLFRSVLMTTDEKVAGGRKQFVLSGGELTDALFVSKMITVFDRNLTVKVEDDIEKRIYSINEGKLTSHYHFVPGNLTRTTKILTHSRTIGDKHADDDINEDDIDALHEAAFLERDTFTQVKETFRQMSLICMNRDDTETNIVKERNVFEVALEKVDAEDDVEVNTSGVINVNDSFGSDYLTPFLRNLKDPSNLSREDAMDIRQTCLDCLKARLVERANIIQSRLNEENSKLARKQEQFTRAQRDGEMSNEEYEKYCTEAMFRINILEKRLMEHEESALKKFADLDNKLSQDPRLKVLKAQMS